MRSKGMILAIATFILGNGTSAGLQITGVINPSLGWWLIASSTAVGIGLFIYAFKLKTPEKGISSQDDGTALLRLLDEVYKRLKVLTELTIIKLRKNEWSGFQPVTNDMVGLTGINLASEMQDIVGKGITQFMSGKPLTITQDATRLASKMKESPLFTRNPESLAKDTSISLCESIPYFNKAMKRDRKYSKLRQQITRERDKFPSKHVSDEIDAYLDHSIKINTAWVIAEHALDGMKVIEDKVGQSLPTQFKLQLKNLSNQMDVEMEQYRNKVAIVIAGYLSGMERDGKPTEPIK